jgi:hypothetical protein
MVALLRLGFAGMSATAIASRTHGCGVVAPRFRRAKKIREKARGI